MNEECIKLINQFNNMPDTIEKLEISNQYLNDELSSFEFYCEAKKYIESK